MKRAILLVVAALAVGAGSRVLAGPTPPAAPTDLSFNGNETLTWTDNSDNESGFHIIATTRDTSQVFRYETAADATTFTLPPEARIQCPPTSITYEVSAFNAAGDSATALFGIARDCTPATPSGIRIVNGNLVWLDNSFNEIGFEIRVVLGIQTLEYRVGANVTSWTIPAEARTSCPDRTWIFYGVTAISIYGASAHPGIAITALCPVALPPAGTGYGGGESSDYLLLMIALALAGVAFAGAGTVAARRR